MGLHERHRPRFADENWSNWFWYSTFVKKSDADAEAEMEGARGGDREYRVVRNKDGVKWDVEYRWSLRAYV